MFGIALLSGAALFGFSPGAGAQASEVFTNAASTPLPRRPSIILIVADGLGYGDLSCYGQTKFQTPNLDRLAAEGIRFTSYYAGGAVSSPARAALLLGRDPEHLKQRADVDVPLAADNITVAQVLKQSGYHTGLIGEWNLGGDGTTGAPWHQGFDEFAGYFDPDDAENYYADYMWRYAPRSRLNPTNNLMEDFVGPGNDVCEHAANKSIYTPDLLTKAALNFIKINQPDRFNRFRPFFLLLNYNLPGTANGPVPTDAPFSDEPWPQPEKNKAAMIARLDGYIGQLLEQLQKFRHDQQYGDFLHQRHRTAKERRNRSEVFLERRAVSRRSRRPLRRRPARADDCALAGQNSAAARSAIFRGRRGIFCRRRRTWRWSNHRRRLTAFPSCRR